MQEDEISPIESDVHNQLSQANHIIQIIDQAITQETNDLYRNIALKILNFIHNILSSEFLLKILKDEKGPLEEDVESEEKITSIKDFFSIQEIELFFKKISQAPYSTSPLYHDISEYFEILKNPTKKPHFKFHLSQLIANLQAYQQSINQIQINNFSFPTYWTQIQSIVKEGMTLIYLYYAYWKVFAQTCVNVKNQPEFQENLELFQPIVDLLKNFKDPRWMIYVSKEEHFEYKQLLENSLLANRTQHESILQAYNCFITNRNKKDFKSTDLSIKKARIILDYIKTREEIDDLVTDSNIIKWIKILPDIKSILSRSITNSREQHISEEEYREDINEKFNLIQNNFELLRYFFFFIQDLYANSTDTLNTKMFSKGYEWRGLKFSVSLTFRKIRRNRTFCNQYPALFDQITLIYEKLRTFRHTSAHYIASLNQNLYHQKEVRYIKKHKKRTIPYKDFIEIAKLAANWLDSYEKVSKFHQSQIPVFFFINLFS